MRSSLFDIDETIASESFLYQSRRPVVSVSYENIMVSCIGISFLGLMFIPFSLRYSTYLAMQEPQKLLDVMDLRTYARLQNSLATEYGVTQRVEFSNPSLLGSGTDWQDEVFQQAIMKSHQLSYSGSSALKIDS